MLAVKNVASVGDPRRQLIMTTSLDAAPCVNVKEVEVSKHALRRNRNASTLGL